MKCQYKGDHIETRINEESYLKKQQGEVAGGGCEDKGGNRIETKINEGSYLKKQEGDVADNECEDSGDEIEGKISDWI